MEVAEFTTLPPVKVSEIVRQEHPKPLGVGMPFNGTRRWYMATFQKTAQEVYSYDYLDRTLKAMLETMGMMFADGVHTVYTPIIGRDLAQRGPEYMEFSNRATANIGNEESLAWYEANKVHAAAYGQTELLFPEVQKILQKMTHQIHVPRHFIRYGVFADHPLQDILNRTVELYERTQKVPSEQQLLENYYTGNTPPVDIWIGSDQPTVFDVPMQIHGNTALYFLQFPTLFMNQTLWRRILYDVLFIRGDQETLYPENIADAHHITGLGVRKAGYWSPATN